MNSIRTRLLMWLMVPLAVVAGFVSLETFYSSRKISNDLNDRTLLAASLTILEHVVSTNGNLLAEATLETLTESLGDRFFYHVTGPNGAFVTGYSEFPRPPIQGDVALDEPVYFDGVHQGVAVRAVRVRRDLTERELNGVTTITTWQHVGKRSELTFSLFSQSLMRLLLLVLAAGAIVWFAVLLGLRPLIRLQAAIDQRTPYDLNPIKRKMPLELAGIVGSMNELFERVARSKKNRERFIGDAAHQLRNPVAAIKVQAETSLEANSKTAMQSGLQQIVDVTDRSDAMISKLLSGASAYAMDRSQNAAFDLSELVNERARIAGAAAFDKGQEFSVSGTDTPVMVSGNQVLLGEAVSNLIDNAIRHNPTDAKIGVRLETGDNQVTISVSDTGKPFSQEAFLELTQPFLTGGDDLSGSGLGLSIAKDIAKAHGGYLATFQEEDGKRVSLMLPTGS
ncbi:MAG: sensor histidine kinase [Pseudomonadota bacterium]